MTGSQLLKSLVAACLACALLPVIEGSAATSVSKAVSKPSRPCTAVFLKRSANRKVKIWAVRIRARKTNCSKARSIAKRRGIDEAGGPKGVVSAWECEWNRCRQGQREVRWALAYLDPDFKPKNKF